jgi:hypothetical protein
MDEFERTIVELEAVFTDPELQKVLTQAREYNELIKDDPASSIDAACIVAELNKRWKDNEFYGKEMFITGPVIVGGRYQVVEDAVTCGDITHMTGAAMTSQGFSMLNIVEDKEGVLHYSQKLVMWGYMDFDDDEGIGGTRIEHCGVVINDDVSIECKEMTPAKVAAWLEVYHNDTKRDIDNALINSTNEADATLRLGVLEYPINESKKKEKKKLKSYIEKYLNHMNQYERNIAYLVELIGTCEAYFPHDGGYKDTFITTNFKTPMLITEILLRENDEKTMFIPWISGSLVGHDKKAAMLIRMPLETIYAIESGRDIYKRA